MLNLADDGQNEYEADVADRSISKLMEAEAHRWKPTPIAPHIPHVNKFEQYPTSRLRNTAYETMGLARRNSESWSQFLTQIVHNAADAARDRKVKNPDGTYRLHTQEEAAGYRNRIDSEREAESKDRRKQYKQVANDMCDMLPVMKRRLEGPDKLSLTLKDKNGAACARVRASMYTPGDLDTLADDLETVSSALF